MPIIDLQRRFRELGRIRTGEKGEKGQPVRRDTFRLTSPAVDLLERAAELWGGTVQEWAGAPTEGTQWELATETSELPVLVPPQDLDGSQYMELWAAGGVKRRCDTVTDLVSGRPCLCNPDKRDCQITTHLLVILPQLQDLGVWRITTHGYNAATELPTTVTMLRQLHEAGQMPGAKLAIESRTSKSEGKTRHFIVPVLRVPFSLTELAVDMKGGVPVLQGTRGKPAIGAGADLPEDPSFKDTSDGPEFGPPPDLPGEGEKVTRAQVVKLHALAGDHGWDETEKHKRAGVESFNDLTKEKASALIEEWSSAAAQGENVAENGDTSADGPDEGVVLQSESEPAADVPDPDLQALHLEARQKLGSRGAVMKAAHDTFGIAVWEKITADHLRQIIGEKADA